MINQVIKGLECCLSASLGETTCPTCTYRYDENGVETGDCEINLLKDAIALLKAQEPRVLTLVELEHAEVAYAENIDKDEIIPILVNGRQYDRINMVRARFGGVFRPSIFDYNKRWRCWTSKPTNKQRQETKWV